MPPAGVQTPAERMVVEPVLDDQKPKQKTVHVSEPEEFEQAPLLIALVAYLNLALLVVFGYIRDFMRMFGYECTVGAKEWGNEGFPPLYHEFESFYHRNVYHRGSKLTAAPLAGVPGAEIDIIDREWGDASLSSFKLSDKKRRYLNVGSYNYLGFAQNEGYCSHQTVKEIRGNGCGLASPRKELGTHEIHRQLETLVAQFVGKESALVFGMGFATNSLNLPALVDEGCLLISDSLNHSCIILGARLSGAKIAVFKHNDVEDLERVLKRHIVMGQTRTRRPWRKILICVEGLYSMEGTLCNLPAIVELKKKYKAYLFIDEAHSIGAMGERGRGVSEHFGVDTADIDIMMGTFSKSFGACGGYIASSKDTIAHLKRESHAHTYASPMSPPVARQIIASMSLIRDSEDGKKRLRQLADNVTYFRNELRKRGYIIYGDSHSPVIPVILFTLANICAFAKECLNRGLATVIVAFPATTMLGARARFCVSASHTREHIDRVLTILEELDPMINLKMSANRPGSAFLDFWRHFFTRPKVPTRAVDEAS
ncbi:hypothetical protein ACHWQZ_G005370 [Mnemiopsis leidyi]